ncbi:GNAT family N-acetyltransferase [Neoehrlichia mikurensis]|uniref:GNAT family N-acetyltransferase n=1 Tax=Neoehrlichia mikurensis TaxID=89586 RepID=A0A9Q9F3N4_9RICK|nr:GNAT family N-acetyltransferase [Neoehrlichia mikurensis]QXK92138.1 GNAT family N-acetyltransferase [Neoehrlichia mikurensis]QXK92595.1 GNAT family N-acetyltransferase [Neoehrlichia mikurensis]QXK93832.1 GNAT family N-acetyltransferase [Neoehrlichia mikurensis]UTO55173.1 GNAT family N-acetyltransferase [Neoehrlichia mikurensis]UTO56093.1 GNAT family N-acetyltransferase [Neoehrlichia mikurensis]
MHYSLVTNNLKQYIIYANQLSGWELHTFNNVTLIINGSKSSIFNYVFLENCTNNICETSIQKTFQYLQQRKIEATWPLDQSSKYAKPILEKLGLMIANSPKKAIVDITNYFMPHNKIDITLEIVDNHSKLTQLDLLASQIFHCNVNEVALFLRGLSNHKVSDSKLQFFLVKLHNTLVGICGMYIHNQVAGFYSDGVLPEYRNQQIGTSMTLQRIKIAQQHDCKYAVAQCMKPSINLYKRLGFKMIGNLPLYVSYRI